MKKTTSRFVKFIMFITALAVATMACITPTTEVVADPVEAGGNFTPTEAPSTNTEPQQDEQPPVEESIAPQATPVFVQVGQTYVEHAAQVCGERVFDEIVNDDTSENTTWSLVTVCQDYNGQVDVIDVAMVATFAIPGPADDAVVGLVWLGKTVIKVIFVASAGYATATGIYQITHSDWNHDPDIEGSIARTKIAVLLATWTTAVAATGGPNNQIRCGFIRDASNAIVRGVIFFVEGGIGRGIPGTMGNISWYHVENGVPTKWGGSYDVTLEQYQRGMSDATRAQRGWRWTPSEDCKNLPGGGIPPLQPPTLSAP